MMSWVWIRICTCYVYVVWWDVLSPLHHLQLMPSPKWKLIVEVGSPQTENAVEVPSEEEIRLKNLLTLVQGYMPADKRSPLAMYLPGFTSLQMLLQKKSRSNRDDQLVNLALASYESYQRSGYNDADLVSMVARDFMLMSKQTLGKDMFTQVDSNNVSDYSGNSAVSFAFNGTNHPRS
jgi:hypothetical protein